MGHRLYCNLYLSENLLKKKEKIIADFRKNKLRSSIYIVALPSGERNQLEFYSGLLLRQHIYDSQELFVVGFADGYDGALELVESITEEAYRKTGSASARQFIEKRQAEFDRTGQVN